MNNPYSAPSAQIEEFDQGDETYKPRVFSLEGRIGRIRYIGYSWLAMIVASFFCGLILAILPVSAKGPGLFMLVLYYIPILAAAVVMARRRLHDLDQSGGWAVLSIIPIINILFGLYLIFAPGTDGPNNYGPPPDKSTSVIWLVILMVPVIGILAAVAIPAYQSYVMRAKAAHVEAPQPIQQDQQPQQNQQ